MNDELKEFINYLAEGGWLEVTERRRGYIKAKALKKMEQSPFGMIRHHEFEQIAKLKNGAASILILSFLRMNTYKGRKQPEVYFCHLKLMEQRLGLSSRAVMSAINSLSSIGIIHGEEQGRYKDSHGNWHSGVYLFIDKVKYINNEVDQSYDWQKEFELASKWLLKKSKTNDVKK